MRISFLSHTLEIRSFESKNALVKELSASSAGRLLLGENAEQEVDFYSLQIRLNPHGEQTGPSNNLFGIGICSQGVGLKPELLLLPDQQSLLMGFNSEMSLFHVPSLTIRSKKSFGGSPFRFFLPLIHRRIVLAFHEIGVVAIYEDGNDVWAFETDVITDFHLHGDWLELTFMDSPPVRINVVTGQR